MFVPTSASSKENSKLIEQIYCKDYEYRQVKAQRRSQNWMRLVSYFKNGGAKGLGTHFTQKYKFLYDIKNPTKFQVMIGNGVIMSQWNTYSRRTFALFAM